MIPSVAEGNPEGNQIAMADHVLDFIQAFVYPHMGIRRCITASSSFQSFVGWCMTNREEFLSTAMQLPRAPAHKELGMAYNEEKSR